MKSRGSSLLLRLSLLFVSALSILSGPANAETARVTEATDFWFTYTEPTTFSVRTYAVDGIGSDPMLWLYNSDDQLIAQNDDWYGLQSHIQIQVEAGTYRLRAGVCCGDPNRWWQGVQYDIEAVGLVYVPESTTTSSSSTTTSSTTTTTSSTTTTSTTTTTIAETTTTWPTTTMTVLTPTVTVETTTAPASTVAPSSTIETLVPQEQSNDYATTTTTSIPVVARTTTTTTTTTTVPATTTTSEPTTTVPSTTVPPNEALKAQEEAIQALQSGKELTVEALEAVLDDIHVETLTEEQEAQLVSVLNVANEEVKKAFEDKVNVYAEGLDDYVPSGSVVPVKTRRVLIATAGLFMSFPTVTASAKSEVRRRK